jgi:hypothetical protein
MHTKTDTALSRNKDTAITLANAVDVVYGRGNHLVIHPGNIYYRSLVDALAEYYVAFPKHKKKLVSDLVHESIQAQTPTGRFLAEVRTGHYTELDVETAIRKISQCFREKQPMIKASSPSYGKTKVKMNTDEVSQKIQEMRVGHPLNKDNKTTVPFLNAHHVYTHCFSGVFRLSSRAWAALWTIMARGLSLLHPPRRIRAKQNPLHIQYL